MALAAYPVNSDPCQIRLEPDQEIQAAILETVVGLDAWFDTQRRTGGYGGPVVHWWRDCLSYTGPGLDWRYEGIICGYLNLWERSGNLAWLGKAIRASDDLVKGQIPSGNFRNSRFEGNPGTGGTPHEAACDLALLNLAEALRARNDPTWEKYYRTARHNLQAYFIERLWDARGHYFRDDAVEQCFVPNKAATVVEALFALTHLTGEIEWSECYALPSLEAVLEHQVTSSSLEGAIYQNSFGPYKVEKFFPYYIARCIPGLIKGFAWSGDERYAHAALRAAGFIIRSRFADGSFPQVIYPAGHTNRYPQWVAATGDMLRSLTMACQIGFEFSEAPTLDWLLAGRQADGSIRTAVGFGKVTPGGTENDLRDYIPVCGWADKAFHYLSSLVPKVTV